MDGPGKYDNVATTAREATDAAGVVLVVLSGRLGNGFSVQARSPEMVDALPSLLRQVADQIFDSVHPRVPLVDAADLQKRVIMRLSTMVEDAARKVKTTMRNSEVNHVRSELDTVVKALRSSVGE